MKLPRGMFQSETELCQRLIDRARAAGYQAHPEVSSWDVVLVSPEGVQVGVQAKLRPSVDVLAQTLVREQRSGPAVHAVLVPSASDAFITVARELRILVLEGAYLNSDADLVDAIRRAPKWAHPKPEWVPEVEMDFPAGVPSPRRMSKWKIGAVRLCLLAHERGFVTAADMREWKLDRAWWFDPRFGPVLKIVGRGQYEFVDSTSEKNPDRRWPEVVRALLPEIATRRLAALATGDRAAFDRLTVVMRWVDPHTTLKDWAALQTLSATVGGPRIRRRLMA